MTSTNVTSSTIIFGNQMSPAIAIVPPSSNEPVTTPAEQTPIPITPPAWKIPLLRLRVNDVSSDGSTAFFEHVNATKLLREAVVGVLNALYTLETAPTHVRSVTLVLRSMGGVAYTTGSEIDDDHKEIHFSTDYIGSIPEERARDEIIGVVRHEMVHCWQYNGLGTCPGGLIEGIADWVRLRDGYCPPHWSRGGSKWDDGYQHTAYFLDWCEEKCGKGFVHRLNLFLKDNRYTPKIWQDLSNGSTVEELWKEYCELYKLGQKEESDDEDNRSEDGDNRSEDGDNRTEDGDNRTEDGDNRTEDGDNRTEDGDEVRNTLIKLQSSEDESVDIARREEAADNEELHYIDGVEENKLALDQMPERASDWLAEEKEALFLRYRLQKTFLPNDGKPNIDEFPDADTYFTFLESMEDVPPSILQKSKLPKVLRFIGKLDDPEVVQSPFNFKSRARALVEKWATALPKETDDSPISSIPPAFSNEEVMMRNELISREETIARQETLKFLDNLAPSLRQAVLLEQKEATILKMPVEIQRETNEFRRQAGLALFGTSSEANQTVPVNSAIIPVTAAAQYDGPTSDVEQSDDGTETDYEHSCVCTAHESTILSSTASDSCASETVLSHSRGSAQRVQSVRQALNGHQTHDSSSTASSSSSWGSSWRYQGNESQVTVIARKKLAGLSFSGDVDGARFIKEFEKLVEKAQPDMSDDDKRILLTTSFTGEKVNIWYEELDIDDSMTYEELKAALIDTFKGMSRRGKKLEGGALLDF